MIILKNGTIFNGEDTPPFIGNIYIENDRIVRINDGAGVGDGDAEILDCTGLCIAPGFIDAHSHNDFFAAQDNNLKYFEPFIRQGVTSMVCGNCGFSAAGYLENGPYNHEIGGGLFTNKGRDFSSFDKWQKLIPEKSPVNILSLVGHGTVRISLNSMAGSELDNDQLRKMEEIIDKALSEGAAGVSLGLMYEPGQFAPLQELEMVAGIVKKHNKVLSFHSRAMSKVSTSYTPPVGGRAHGLRAIDEVIKIAKKTGVKTQLSHLIFVGEKSWSYVDEALSLLENAKKDDVDIMFDMYAMDFGASIITVVLPIWYLSLTKEKRGGFFVKLRLAIETAVTKKLLGFGFNDIMISNTKGMMPQIEGRRISELAGEWNMSELQAYLKVVDETDAKADVLMYKYANPAIIEKLRLHPLSLYMTDAWVNEQGVQNFAVYYNFPKFISLAMRSGTPVQQAINKMSGATAERYNISDRGFIKEGKKADITVFNSDKLNFTEGRGESPLGIEYVLINGRIVLKHGEIQSCVKDAGEFIKV
ncbi:MAG: hypothetical protein CVV49_17955 [Spirochaetae bacterium HGW-Spirochaetae-5]|nr:MAG: hypothetical protein CVV49_17955 [Spirochaetae bacterium HGW-Spirochaetae-5]